MGFFKKLRFWQKRTTKKTQRKEEMYGGECWWTIKLTIKVEDAPLVQDATFDEDHLRFELRKRNTATTMRFFKKLRFWRKRTTKITQREEEMHGGECWWTTELRTPIYQGYTDILEASHSQYATIVPETPIYQELPDILEASHSQYATIVPETPIHQEAPSILEAPPEQDAPGEQDAIVEETEEEVSNFKQEVKRLTHQDAPGEKDAVLEESEDEVSILKQEVQQLTQQLYMEIRQSTAATGEDQLIETKEIAHLSMLQKMKIVAQGVFLGLVVFLLTLLEVEQH